ncbi:MAG: hypothetical protein AAFY34_03055 [Pseudomonadota bacterium]
MDEPKQLRLDFPERPPDRTDLVVTAANEAAVSAAFAWQDWPSNLLCVFGPPMCGLGLIAHIWAEEADAKVVDHLALDQADANIIRAFAAHNGAIDLADAVKNEANLLTAINFATENSTRLLLTARSHPANWACSSPDLLSRLANMTALEIGPPDDDMVLQRLDAACRKRFIRLKPEDARYIMIRIEKSYVAIEDYVRRLDQAVAVSGRPPSVHLARSVLEEGADTRKLFDQT